MLIQLNVKPFFLNQFQSKQSRLGDSTAHPKMIRNNHLATLYKSQLMSMLTNEIKTEPNDLDLVNISDIKVENALDDEPYIKTELTDFSYDGKISCKLTIETQDVYCESKSLETGIKAEFIDYSYDGKFNRELVIQEEDVDCEPESETESESSIARYEERVNDPDVNFDDFSSDTDDTMSSASDESDFFESSDEDSDPDTTERFECPHCKKLVKKLEAHVERTHGNYAKKINKTICGLCLKKFPYKGNLKDHKKECHNGNAYACDLCHFMTPWFRILRKHIINTHLQDKYFLCHVCAKSYKHEYHLQRHTASRHSDERERTHACHMCDKKYFYSSSLREHIQASHLKEQKFHCKVDGCSKAFYRKGNLVTHQKVHNRNLFSCIICEKKFTFKCNLQTHIKNIHGTT